MALGAALRYLGTSLPAIGSAWDEIGIQKQKAAALAEEKRKQDIKDALDAMVKNQQLKAGQQEYDTTAAANALETQAQEAAKNAQGQIAAGDTLRTLGNISMAPLATAKKTQQEGVLGGIPQDIQSQIYQPLPEAAMAAQNEAGAQMASAIGKKPWEIQKENLAPYAATKTGGAILGEANKQADKEAAVEAASQARQENLNAQHANLQEQIASREALAKQAALDRTSQRSFALNDREDQFQQNQFKSLIEDANPNKARAGAVGMAQTNIQRANRGINILNGDITDPQQVVMLGGDLAGMIKGGTPDQVGMRESTYNSLKSDVAKAMQYWTGHAQEAMPKDLKQRLLNEFQDMKQSSIGALQQHFDAQESGRANIVNYSPKYKEQWQNYRAAYENPDYGLIKKGGGTAGGTTGGTSDDDIINKYRKKKP